MPVLLTKASDKLMNPSINPLFGNIEQLDKYIKRIPNSYSGQLPELTLSIFKAFELPVSIYSCKFTKSGNRRLLLGTSAKTVKGEKFKYKTKVMYLAADARSGFPICPFSTPGCRSLCLGHCSGRMGVNKYDGFIKNDQQLAHFLKTVWFKIDPLNFLRQLIWEILCFGMEVLLTEFKGCIRLNGTSDLPWWNWLDMTKLAADTGLQFYDYTKRPIPPIKLPGYHLTFSISELESSFKTAEFKYLDKGYGAAIVVASKDMTSSKHAMGLKAEKVVENLVSLGRFPGYYREHPVINGDVSDLRFEDKPGSIVLLKAKGYQALTDTSGFVHRFGGP